MSRDITEMIRKQNNTPSEWKLPGFPLAIKALQLKSNVKTNLICLYERCHTLRKGCTKAPLIHIQICVTLVTCFSTMIMLPPTWPSVFPFLERFQDDYLDLLGLFDEIISLGFLIVPQVTMRIRRQGLADINEDKR